MATLSFSLQPSLSVSSAAHTDSQQPDAADDGSLLAVPRPYGATGTGVSSSPWRAATSRFDVNCMKCTEWNVIDLPITKSLQDFGDMPLLLDKFP